MLAAGCAPGVPLVCAASGASRPQRAAHVPVPLARCDPRPPSKTCGGMCAGRATCVGRIRVAIVASRSRHRANRASRPLALLPRPAAGCAPGASIVCAASSASRPQRAAHVPVRLCGATAPRLPMLAAGCAPGVPLVWAASGASRPQRAEHVPVPLARRDRSPPTLVCGGTCDGRDICVCRFWRVAFAASRARPRDARAARPLYAGHGCGEICARRATCVGRIRRVASAASRARPRANRAARPIPAFNGLWRDVRRARHLCVPHSARRDRSEPSTSSCRSAGR